MAHVLVVGGTGMLRQVSLFLAMHDNVVSVIARTAEGLERLKAEAKSLNGRINPLVIDYNDISALRKRLGEAIDTHGAITLAVSWVQSSAVRVSEFIGELLDNTSPVCRYFEVLPGDNEDPEGSAAIYHDPFRNFDKVLRRTIVVGHGVDQGRSRWLTHTEISEGVIEALRNDTRHAVIGNVGPWEERQVSA